MPARPRTHGATTELSFTAFRLVSAIRRLAHHAVTQAAGGSPCCTLPGCQQHKLYTVGPPAVRGSERQRARPPAAFSSGQLAVGRSAATSEVQAAARAARMRTLRSAYMSQPFECNTLTGGSGKIRSPFSGLPQCGGVLPRTFDTPFDCRIYSQKAAAEVAAGGLLRQLCVGRGTCGELRPSTPSVVVVVYLPSSYPC